MNAKKAIILAIGVLFLGSSLLQAQTAAPMAQPLAQFDKLVSQLKSAAVIGEPITAGSTTVIPFAKLSFGLGGGGAMMAYGGGMGGKAIPQGVLIIEGDDVRVELFPEEEKKPSFIMQMLPVLMKMLPEMMGGMGPKAAPKDAGKAADIPKDASLDNVKKLFEAKKYNDAIAMADALLAKDPDNADLHAWKGHAMGTLAGSGNPADMMKYGMGAQQEYETALKLDPDNANGHLGRGMVRLNAPPGFGGDLEGAIKDLEIAAKSKPPFAEAYYQLGQAYKKQGSPDKAKAAFQQALKLKPDFPEAKKALAELK